MLRLIRFFQSSHRNVYPKSTLSEQSGSERFRDDAQEAKDENAGPRVEHHEDWVEIGGLLVRVTDVGGIAKPPCHAENKRHHEESGPLLEVLNLYLLRLITYD